MIKTIGFYTATIAALALICGSAAAQTVVKDGTTTTAVHEAGGEGVVLGSTDYYGSGPDDDFGEYGVTTFNFTSPDFGGTVADITNATLELTVNDRLFSDGDAVEIFFTPDTAADLDSGGGDFSALSYIPTNVPNGIEPTQFVTAPVSVGVFAIPEMAGRAGGEMDMLVLDLTGAEAAMISSINSGTDFQLIVATTVDTEDITYSGVGNTFDPGDPNLSIKVRLVPEPSALTLLLLGGLAFLRRR